MQEAIHTEKHGEYTIKIFQDNDPMNPRSEFDHLGTIYHTHRDYDLGEKMDQESIQAINENDQYVSLPVYIYDHSGVALATKPFGCAWDSGQVGIISVEKAKVLKEWGRKKWSKKLEAQVIKCLEGEIKEFSDYLSGNVYGYVVEKEEICGECNNHEAGQVDSCWGFIGDYEYCLTEARNNVPKEKAA
jgi:hypothetical protein